MGSSLCIDCYGAPATRLDGTLCPRCYQKAHRKSHYHNVIKLDPERLAAHRRQCNAANKRRRGGGRA